MCNPYESPKTANGTKDHAWSLPFDIGRFVGRYLQILACVSIASMAVDLLLFDQLKIDLSFVFFFWAGAALIRHSPTARKWVIGVSGLAIFLSLVMVLYAVTVGTDAMTVTIGRRIDNPPIGYVLGVMSFLVLIAGIPLVLLLTRQARNEFARAARAAEPSNAREAGLRADSIG
jgi:hypothetical protein